MKPLDLATALFVIVIWGLNFVVVKVGVQEMPPFLFMAMRFVVVAAILLPFIRWPKGQFRPLLAYSIVLGVLHFAMMFNAMHLADAATVALLSQLNTPWAVILAAIVFKDYPGWRRILGIVIAFAGCAVIAGEPRFEGGLLPALLVVGGTFLWAVAAVQIKQIGEIGPFALNGWMAAMAAPQLLAISFMVEDGHWEIMTNLSWLGRGAIFFQSVMVVIVGYGLWYGLIKRYPISRVIPLTLLLPVVGVASGVLILDEALTPYMIVGGVLVMIGVGIVTLRQAMRAAPHQPKVPS
ncbi:MAG: EamA family transporter [Alphaproteobacteria bacterium]